MAQPRLWKTAFKHFSNVLFITFQDVFLLLLRHLGRQNCHFATAVHVTEVKTGQEALVPWLGNTVPEYFAISLAWHSNFFRWKKSSPFLLLFSVLLSYPSFLPSSHYFKFHDDTRLDAHTHTLDGLHVTWPEIFTNGTPWRPLAKRGQCSTHFNV